MIKSGSFPALKGESKIVTQADMWSKLARNAKPKVSVDGSSGVDSDTRSVGLTAPRQNGACVGEASEGELPLAGCNSQPAATPIEWGEPEKYGPGAWGIKSTDGRFWIHKVQSRESVTYTAWRRGTGLLGLNERLGQTDTAEEAKALCVAAE